MCTRVAAAKPSRLTSRTEVIRPISIMVTAALYFFGRRKYFTELEIVETPENATKPAENERARSSTSARPSSEWVSSSGAIT